VYGFQFWWRENGVALVELEFVGDVEFFEEEGDAFSLSYLQVVDCDGWHFEG
jgi:hypothetical protein